MRANTISKYKCKDSAQSSTKETKAIAWKRKRELLSLAQSKPDILAIDIGMPKVDGYTLIRQIIS